MPIFLAVLRESPAIHVIRLLRDELEMAMALTGCRTLAQATPALLEWDKTPGAGRFGKKEDC